MYNLEVISNDTYHLYGVMNHTSNVTLAVGIPSDTVISFDVTLDRMYLDKREQEEMRGEEDAQETSRGEGE